MLALTCNTCGEQVNMASKRSAIGDRYRNLHVAAWHNEWIVEAIFTGTEAHKYAYLRSASGQTQCKTLALSSSPIGQDSRRRF
jgi:hypothetical protein